MLSVSVIIVLREVIEPALLFSILMALAKQMDFRLKWPGLFFVLGVLSSYVYAMNINIVSEWFDGVGQELMDAFLQLSLYLVILVYIIVLIRFSYQKKVSNSLLVLVLLVSSILAITREGSEIILYYFSVTRYDTHLSAVFTGMLIGVSTGLSVGLLFYYLLVSIKPVWSINTGLILLILMGAGMISRASISLIQADWLEAQLPLWNTSAWLSEHSVTGQLLHALTGYEATPTTIQLGLYLSSLLLPIILILSLKIKYARTA